MSRDHMIITSCTIRLNLFFMIFKISIENPKLKTKKNSKTKIAPTLSALVEIVRFSGAATAEN